ncbi:hypothetical protein VIBNISFn27_740001 [Vibrio nigripulchritudo SFn27]|nr:hypothetical protein VIBNIBLFn1_1060106 [Vibrio nigripulchritudo BLFn1]CCN90533.1 hypothetical protein VIBNISFn27_740001 [Vibrio nigripulchritudo SFn27]CCN93529.1 hypothetical protein VIBNIENn2_230106 [Vibrio nigripulchritudo ENn2]
MFDNPSNVSVCTSVLGSLMFKTDQKPRFLLSAKIQLLNKNQSLILVNYQLFVQ